MKNQWKGFVAGTAVGVTVAASVGVLAQDAGGLSPQTRQQMRRIQDAFNAVRTNFVTVPDETKMADGCIGGMVRKLDPAGSDFIDAAEFRELQVGSAPAGGLGLELGATGDVIRVVSPIEGTPAHRGGVHAGDLVMKVDDTPTKGLSLADVIKLMRGRPGTEVKLGLLRDGNPLELTLTRELIRINPVRSRLLEAGVGYVRISQFQEVTPERVTQALGTLRQENRGPLKGLVLDLRNNPGGLLYGAIEVASFFLQDDVTVLQLEGRAEDSNKRFSSNPKDFRRGADFRVKLPEEARRVPLVVLVNGGTAAGSEIVAGALQDYKRATVIGSKTFGRGSIQTIMTMEGNTALKLTTAYWKLPGGRAIHGQGIVPDVVLEGDAARLSPGIEFGAANDPGLQRALLALRK